MVRAVDVSGSSVTRHRQTYEFRYHASRGEVRLQENDKVLSRDEKACCKNDYCWLVANFLVKGVETDGGENEFAKVWHVGEEQYRQ